MSAYEPCPLCVSAELVGTTWQINASGRRFVVISVEAQYAVVRNVDRPFRRRRILLTALRTSNRKTGYTQIGADQ